MRKQFNFEGGRKLTFKVVEKNFAVERKHHIFNCDD